MTNSTPNQKLLFVSTLSMSVRADIEGWTYEDGECVNVAFMERIGTKYEDSHKNKMPVGLVGNGKVPFHMFSYPTILHALSDGWKLLGSPVIHVEEKSGISFYEWILHK